MTGKNKSEHVSVGRSDLEAVDETSRESYCGPETLNCGIGAVDLHWGVCGLYAHARFAAGHRND